MADPLSIAASVAGLVTLAASTAKLAKAMTDRYTEQVAASVRGNARTLGLALGGVAGGLAGGFSRPGGEGLRGPVEACAGTLRELEVQFGKLGGGGKSLRDNVLGRLTRPDVLKEIQRLQGVLEGQKTTLLVAMQNFSGENQQMMMGMIFAAIEELRAAVAKGRPGTNSGDEVSLCAMTPSGDEANEPSIVEGYPSFEGWLEKWTVSDEDQDKNSGPASGEVVSEDVPPAASSGPQIVTLVVEGQTRGGRTATSEIHTTTDTPLYDIIFELDRKGYYDVCGFQMSDKSIQFPPFLPWNTSLVVVTDERSSYDVHAGLRINRRERFIDFYNECLRRILNPAASSSSSKSPVVGSQQSGLNLRSALDPERRTNITFQRTLRLPEDGKAHGTSSFLGPFPLFQTKDFKSRLPQEMDAKGGVFFPIFQREALALSFTDMGVRHNVYGSRHSDYRSRDDNYRNRHDRYRSPRETREEQFAIRVYAGAINCLSGKTALEAEEEERDYIVCPKQKRLDGYRSPDGDMRQFVAMPLEWEYSAEHRITGREEVGGIQLQIAARLRDRVEFRRIKDLWCVGWGLRRSSSPADLELGAGELLAMTDFDEEVQLLSEVENSFEKHAHWPRQPWLHPMDGAEYRITTVQDLLQCLGAPETKIHLLTVPPLDVRLRLFRDASFDFEVEERLRCSPFLSLGALATERIHHYHYDCGHCDKCKDSSYTTYPDWGFATQYTTHLEAWPEQHRALESLLAGTGSELRLVCIRTRVGHSAYAGAAISYPEGRLMALSARGSWGMALGAGARLLQRIRGDKAAASWDWENSCLVSVQLLNAAAFRSVTGIPAWTPVSLREYEERQLTLQVPLAQGLASSNTGSKMPELRYIGQMDLMLSDDAKARRRIVLCSQCETNLCNVAILPCKHIFCSDCLNSNSKSKTCFQCGGVSKESLTFAGPMEFSSTDNTSRLLDIDELRLQLESLPNYRRSHAPYESAETVAERLTYLDWGPQSLFWANFLVSVLQRTEPRTRSPIAKALVLSRVKSGSVGQTELLLALLSKESFFPDRGGVRKLELQELLGAAVASVALPTKTRTSSCLEALVAWMEAQDIEARHLLNAGLELGGLVVPQPDASLRRVIAFLTHGGRSLWDYGVTIFILKGGSPIHFLDLEARSRKEALLRALVENGCDIDFPDAWGQTMLWYQTDMILQLLNAGARADVLDKSGNTVLHALVQQLPRRDPDICADCKARIAELLGHERGRAAVDARNADGLTAYHLALGIDSLWDWMGFTGLMKGGGADVNVPVPMGAYRAGLMSRVERWEGEVGRIDALMRKSALKRVQEVRRVLRLMPELLPTPAPGWDVEEDPRRPMLDEVQGLERRIRGS